MSAFYKLDSKKTPPTELELCVLMAGSLVDKESAAAELSAKDARIAKLEALQVIAESVNQWLIQNGLENTAHQLQLAKALQEIE